MSERERKRIGESMALLIIITSVLISGLYIISSLLSDIRNQLKQVSNILNAETKKFADNTNDKDS